MAEYKGGSIRIRPEKLIVTSNYRPEQCFTNREDIAPILRRFRVVEDLADLPPIPEVPAEILEPLEHQEVAGEFEAEEDLLEMQEAWEVIHEVPEAGELEAEEVLLEMQEAGEVIQEVPEVGEGQVGPPQ